MWAADNSTIVQKGGRILYFHVELELQVSQTEKTESERRESYSDQGGTTSALTRSEQVMTSL